MRKFFYLFVGLVLVGAGCSSTSEAPKTEEEDTVGIANSAAVYCEEQGGEIKIAENEEESTSYCVFPDGSVCEEFAFYNGECDPKEEVSKETQVPFALASDAFENGAKIPTKYSCDGSDVNPPLAISEVPEGAKSLALIVDDPDAPGGTWVHWVVWNIDPEIGMIEENSKPGLEGLTSFGNTGWGGPCPPSGTHRYFFKVYALDVELEKFREEPPDADSIRSMMTGHVLGEAELMGTYSY